MVKLQLMIIDIISISFSKVRVSKKERLAIFKSFYTICCYSWSRSRALWKAELILEVSGSPPHLLLEVGWGT